MKEEDIAAIHGLGVAKAKILLSKWEIKSVDDLKKPHILSSLPLETQYWLKYKPLEKIPRKLINRFERKFAQHMRGKWCIAGSYRRKKSFSRDIDILTTTPIQIVLKRLLSFDPKVYSSGPEKASLLINFEEIWIKLDIMHTSDDEWGPFLLYLTGSKEHNILMRHKAKINGMLLNQKGLFKGTIKVPIKTEQDIFNALKMKYKTPENR